MATMPRLQELQDTLHTSDTIFGGLRIADSYSEHYNVTGLSSITGSRVVWANALSSLYAGLATIRTKAVFNAKGALVFKAYASGRYVGRWNTVTNNGSIISWYDILRGGV